MGSLYKVVQPINYTDFAICVFAGFLVSGVDAMLLWHRAFSMFVIQGRITPYIHVYIDPSLLGFLHMFYQTQSASKCSKYAATASNVIHYKMYTCHIRIQFVFIQWSDMLARFLGQE